MTKFLRYSTLSRLIGNVRATGENITGHSEVLLSQKQVKEHKDALKTWRKELATATKSYEEIQQQLKGLYARKTHVYQGQKRDLSVLQAINDEEESLLYNEQKLSIHLEECKRQERESFEALSDAIQDSHEKERAQSERMKYYTRIGSLLGAFFGFLGSNFFVRREVRRHNSDQTQKLSQIEALLARTDIQDSVSRAKIIDNIQEQVSSINQSVSTLSDVFNRHLENVKPKVKSTPDVKAIVRTDPKHINSDRVVLGGIISYSLLMASMALLQSWR